MVQNSEIPVGTRRVVAAPPFCYVGPGTSVVIEFTLIYLDDAGNTLGSESKKLPEHAALSHAQLKAALSMQSELLRKKAGIK